MANSTWVSDHNKNKPYADAWQVVDKETLG